MTESNQVITPLIVLMRVIYGPANIRKFYKSDITRSTSGYITTLYIDENGAIRSVELFYARLPKEVYSFV